MGNNKLRIGKTNVIKRPLKFKFIREDTCAIMPELLQFNKYKREKKPCHGNRRRLFEDVAPGAFIPLYTTDPRACTTKLGRAARAEFPRPYARPSTLRQLASTLAARRA